mmetsp:Transcript_10403/g.29726  ORF Transcript_10403/g.29726 Transcript_10403/m.29726 type:complete len:224 (+) Transcript_10403:2257-2928(+)
MSRWASGGARGNFSSWAAFDAFMNWMIDNVMVPRVALAKVFSSSSSRVSVMSPPWTNSATSRTSKAKISPLKFGCSFAFLMTRLLSLGAFLCFPRRTDTQASTLVRPAACPALRMLCPWISLIVRRPGDREPTSMSPISFSWAGPSGSPGLSRDGGSPMGGGGTSSSSGSSYSAPSGGASNGGGGASGASTVSSSSSLSSSASSGRSCMSKADSGLVVGGAGR